MCTTFYRHPPQLPVVAPEMDVTTPMITITIMISIRENPFCLVAKIPYKPLFFNIHHFIVVVAQHNAIL